MRHQIWKGLLIIIWSGVSFRSGPLRGPDRFVGGSVYHHYISFILWSRTSISDFFDNKYFVLLWKTYFGGLELKTWLSLYVFCFKCISFSKLSGDRIRNISRFHQSKEIVVDLSVALPFTISSYNVSSLYLYRRISIENKTWAVFGNSSNNRFIA